jgi:hypothetical protein
MRNSCAMVVKTITKPNTNQNNHTKTNWIFSAKSAVLFLFFTLCNSCCEYLQMSKRMNAQFWLLKQHIIQWEKINSMFDCLINCFTCRRLKALDQHVLPSIDQFLKFITHLLLTCLCCVRARVLRLRVMRCACV